MSKPYIEVAAAVILNEGKCLIAQRRADQHLANMWEFPGGKIKKEESPEECLVRELQEELGIQVRVGDLLESVLHHYEDRDIRLYFFYAVIESGTPQKIQVQDIRWVPLQELEEYEFPPADDELIKLLIGDEIEGNFQ